MARFLSGPAKGVHLELRRLPRLLRVVHDTETGEWDALDQLDDDPEDTEMIYVYRRQGEPARGFVCSRAAGCAGFVEAEYHVIYTQPPDATLRDTEAWREWANAAVRGDSLKNSQETN